MKIEKILSEIIQDRVRRREIRYHIALEANSVSVFNGFVLYKIPISEWLLDFDKLNSKAAGNPLVSLRESDFDIGALTGGIKRVKDDKTKKMVTLIEIKAPSGELIYVDEAILKYFDEYEVKVKDRNNMVLVYENAMLVGVVCPYHVK